MEILLNNMKGFQTPSS